MENARPLKNEESSAPNSANFNRPLTPRQKRALDALMPGDLVAREAMDRIVGASNSPHTIMELRRLGLGDDGIETIREEVKDRDGRSTRPGRFRLTAVGRQRAIELGLVA